MSYVWVRTCQECGNKQIMKSPIEQKTDNWKDAKCRKCNSQALDYGQNMEQLPSGKLVRIIDDTDLE